MEELDEKCEEDEVEAKGKIVSWKTTSLET